MLGGRTQKVRTTILGRATRNKKNNTIFAAGCNEKSGKRKKTLLKLIQADRREFHVFWCNAVEGLLPVLILFIFSAFGSRLCGGCTAKSCWTSPDPAYRTKTKKNIRRLRRIKYKNYKISPSGSASRLRPGNLFLPPLLKSMVWPQNHWNKNFVPRLWAG